MAEPADPDRQLEELCRVRNYFGVGYVVFGSHVARLNGVPMETVDVDVVPDRMVDNLTRLAEALNLLRPRWRVEGIPEGMKIDGGWKPATSWATQPPSAWSPGWVRSTS